MRTRYDFIAVAVLGGVAVLSGCADGPGGGAGITAGPAPGVPDEPAPRVANFVSFDQPPASGEMILAGETTFVTLNSDTVAGASGTTGGGGPGAGWMIFTDYGSSGEGLVIESEGGDAVFTGTGVIRLQGGGSISYSDGGGVNAVIADPDHEGFLYQTFGLWGIDQPGGAVVGMGSFGAPMPDGATHSSPTAFYDGTARGYVVANGHTSTVSADVRVDTDFVTAEFETRDTAIDSGSVGLSGAGALAVMHRFFEALEKPQVTTWSIVVSFLVATAVGIIFGLYPAVQASRQDPIVALRHD